MTLEEVIKKASWTPSHISSLAVEGYDFLMSQNYNEALACFYVAHHLDSKEWYHAILLGICLTHTKQYREALYYLNIATRLDANPSISVHKINVFLALKDFNRAKEEAYTLAKDGTYESRSFANGILSIIDKS